jgi:hypothetical protein
VTVTRSLGGLNDASSGGFEPPDVQVAAGPGFVVELVNLAARVWRTGGAATQLQTQSLSSLFASGDDRLTDPRILYDAPSGRWLASIADVDRSSILLAVSTGADPTGPWTITKYAAGGCPDQPRIGLADGMVVLAADVFTSCDVSGSESGGSELWTVNKQQLLAGSTSPDVSTFGPDTDYSSLSPAQSLSSTPTVYVVAVNVPSSRLVHLLAVDGIPPADVSVREIATPPITRLSRPPFAAQPPSSTGRPEPGIEANDDRVLDAVWENGRLWFTANTACMPAGDVLLRACGRAVELSTATGTVDWEAELSHAGAHVFYPAMRPDGAGNVVIVYGRSGASVTPQLVAVGRTPDGTLTLPEVIAQSAGAYLGDRYGDYFGAARDPVDPRVVWVAGEAGADLRGSHGWRTAVASVAVTPAGAEPPAVLSSPPPGVRAVGAAPRVGDAVRLAYRSLDDGSAIRAAVTVRTAKAVVFTLTTRETTLREDQLYTVAWRTKLRGRFRYCVHTVSPRGLASPESCATIRLR